MEKVFTAKLKGGLESAVYFSTKVDSLEKKIKEYGDNVIFIFDGNTRNLVSVDSKKALVLPAGEEYKNYKSIGLILDKALDLSLARDSLFIAIGGGVICDMTAFASSIYMRGARCVLVPTTLLSMVDASVGGKSGIDYAGYKNIVGTFFPAEDILICLETLSTLSDKEFLCGLGEVVKHAFLSPDDKLYDYLSLNADRILSRDLDALKEVVRLSLEVKKHFIELDPEEKKGIRSFLNLGHTFGHALESITNYQISHGEGVAWGTLKAFDAGVRIGVTPEEYRNKALKLFSLYPFSSSFRIPEDRLDDFIKAISKDKKKSKGSVKFVLMKGQGEPILLPLERETIESVLA